MAGKSPQSETNVTFVDTAARDGIVTAGACSISDKVAFINRLAEAGLKHIDCVAFTHPRLIPKHADAERVMQEINKASGVAYIGLAPNEIGCRRAVVAGVDQVLTLVAASDEYNKLSLGRCVRDTLNKTLPAIFEVATQAGKGIRAYILTAFGCPYTGRILYDDVIGLIQKLSFMGVKEISIVDSAGMANPKSVKDFFREVFSLKLKTSLAAHFHNNRGLGMANCIAAYEAGIRIFDTALGGLSGTPFGSIDQDIGNWNLPTEDLVQAFEEMGIRTGIDMDRLLETVEFAERIVGKPLPGHILRARPSSSKFALPAARTSLA